MNALDPSADWSAGAALRRSAKSVSGSGALFGFELRPPLRGLGVVLLTGLVVVPERVELHERQGVVARLLVLLAAHLDPDGARFEEVRLRLLELLQFGSGLAQVEQNRGETARATA